MATILVADVGGTTTRVALAAPGGRPEQIVRFENDDISGVDDALRRYLDRVDAKPHAATIAVAGPIAGEEIALTNRPWRFRREEMRAQFGFERFDVLNDFQAVAWGLPALQADELLALGPAGVPGPGPKVALGPGTGLGVAALIPNGADWVVAASEGGHMSFGAAAEEEVAIFRSLGNGSLRVSAETAVSGRGIERLWRAMNPEREPLPARGVVAAAHAGDPGALAVIDQFVRLFGRFAGDVALVFRATGGVYIAGGIARRFGTLFNSVVFREAFEAHPPYVAMLEQTPTFLVTCVEPGLLGCAAYAGRMAARA
jgi:glucokinase